MVSGSNGRARSQWMNFGRKFFSLFFRYFRSHANAVLAGSVPPWWLYRSTFGNLWARFRDSHRCYEGRRGQRCETMRERSPTDKRLLLLEAGTGFLRFPCRQKRTRTHLQYVQYLIFILHAAEIFFPSLLASDDVFVARRIKKQWACN